MQWIESGGGPLVVVPRAVLTAWRGSEESGGESGSVELADLGDYARACAVTGYADVIGVGGAQALVLNDDPAPTTYLPGRRAFVRLRADSADDAVSAFVEREFAGLAWTDEVSWQVDGDCVLFDSAFSGAQIETAGYLDVPVPPGRYLVHTANVERGDLWLSLTRLSREAERNWGDIPAGIRDIADSIVELSGAGRVTGLTQAEIGELLQCWGRTSLPGRYLEFLWLMGREAGCLLRGTDAFYPRTLKLPEFTAEFLEENDQQVAPPSDSIVFAMHQGYQIYWLENAGVDDPPVVLYMEGEAAPTRRWASFTQFLRSQFLEDCARRAATADTVHNGSGVAGEAAG